ncbi:MAG: aldose epimerase family protein [Saprospiraceae bacterium]
MQIKVGPTDHVVDGYHVEEFTLINDQLFELKVTNYGCTIMGLWWPNPDGSKTDVLLGYDTVEEWFKDEKWFGSTAGRCCNRIRNARFFLDGIEYILDANIPPHQLHGGIAGFHKKNWRAYPEQTTEYVGVKMYLLSRNGDQGYPGNVSVEALIALTNRNEIIIQYKAVTDQETLVNITSHPYFNLNGSGSILDHKLWINADRMLVNDKDSIPTGEFLEIKGTAFDFTKTMTVKENLEKGHEQIDFANGIDQNFVLNVMDETKAAATISSEQTNRKITFYTNQPGIQFYTGNHLEIPGKKNTFYQKHDALCMETQKFPDAIHFPHFPSVVLHPGEQYKSWTRIACE